MASGSQATVRTCNDYSDSKVRSFSSRCGRHDTLSLLAVITKVLVESTTEPATSKALRACQILMEKSKEYAEMGRTHANAIDGMHVVAHENELLINFLPARYLLFNKNVSQAAIRAKRLDILKI